MSDLPSMPFYVDDYEADTAHLTLEEDGAYNRLLRLCWRDSGCSIPDDDVWIARRMRVDQVTFGRLIAPIILEFFDRKKGRVFQKNQQRIHAEVLERVNKKKTSGSLGGKAKALNNRDIDPSNTTVLPEAKEGVCSSNQNQNQNQNQTKELTPKNPPLSRDQIFSAAGLDESKQINPGWHVKQTQQIDAWAKDGLDLESQILPTIRSIMAVQFAKDRNWIPGSLSYFDKAVRRAKPSDAADKTPIPIKDNWRELDWINYLKKRGDRPWNAELMGPPPGEVGSLCPAGLAEQGRAA